MRPVCLFAFPFPQTLYWWGLLAEHAESMAALLEIEQGGQEERNRERRVRPIRLFAFSFPPSVL